MKHIHMKRNHHGFTLVELIVVLVILAILAVLLLPSLTGYIEKTRETRALAEAREVVLAAKAGYADYYVNIDKTPAGNVEKKVYIGTYMSDIFKTELGMGYSKAMNVRAPKGNLFSVETSKLVKGGEAGLVNNVRNGVLGGNCAQVYVKPATLDSLVGIVYFSKDKNYCVIVVLDPQSTTGYTDVAPGTFILQKID